MSKDDHTAPQWKQYCNSEVLPMQLLRVVCSPVMRAERSASFEAVFESI